MTSRNEGKNTTTKLSILNIIRKKGERAIAVCRCECGNIKKIKLCHVKSNEIKSCGCLKKEASSINGRKNTKHGQAAPGKRGKSYRSWECMKSRCCNKNDPNFKNYGGRGIKVCDEWRQSFEKFIQDMGEREDGTSIDRIDNNGNYEPNNCRWAKIKTQQRNKRNNRIVIFNEKPITLIELSEKTNIPYQRLHERIIRRKWTVEDAINKPVKRKH